jgi:hypothetical protein
MDEEQSFRRRAIDSRRAYPSVERQQRRADSSMQLDTPLVV